MYARISLILIAMVVTSVVEAQVTPCNDDNDGQQPAAAVITPCPIKCTCTIISYNFTVQCQQILYRVNFVLPSLSVHHFLPLITRLTVSNSYLSDYPVNLCIYCAKLAYLDLSFNFISTPIADDTFNCLRNLQQLNLSYNYIDTIDSRSFDFLGNLQVLDLSYNRISVIDPNLFYFKLSKLTSLYLSNNLIIDLDVWFLFLPSINIIDLKHNAIKRLTNTKKWNPFYNSQYQSLNMNSLVDLRFNQLGAFDDQVLSIYGACDQEEFEYFMLLFARLYISDNPLVCSCSSSYNTLQFYKSYLLNPVVANLRITNYLIYSQCQASNSYYGKSIFAFEDPATCFASSRIFNGSYLNGQCVQINRTYSTSTTSTAAKFKQFDLKQNSQASNSSSTTTTRSTTLSTSSTTLPTTTTTVTNRSEDAVSAQHGFNLYSSYNIGIFVGIIILLGLVIGLVCVLCSTEIKTCCFWFSPDHELFRPNRKHNKKYDLFISFNPENKRWVKEKLVPYIQDQNLVDNFVLHYNEENAATISPMVHEAIDNSSCILLILSNSYMLNEWRYEELREQIQKQTTKDPNKSSESSRDKLARLVCIQLEELCDEFVEDCFRQSLQVPRLTVLEENEFMFWPKLAYYLYTRRGRVLSDSSQQSFRSSLRFKQQIAPIKLIDSTNSSSLNISTKPDPIVKNNLLASYYCPVYSIEQQNEQTRSTTTKNERIMQKLQLNRPSSSS